MRTKIQIVFTLAGVWPCPFTAFLNPWDFILATSQNLTSFLAADCRHLNSIQYNNFIYREAQDMYVKQIASYQVDNLGLITKSIFSDD